MEPAREAVQAIKTTADQTYVKLKTGFGEATEVAEQLYDKAKNRTNRFVDTGVSHYQQTEEMLLAQFKVFAGISAVLILPRLRRGVMHRTLRPFRSDESIYRSAEARMESVQERLTTNQQRTEKLDKELVSVMEAYTAALRQLKSTSQELNQFSNQIYKDIRMTQELMRDMKDMPSRPSLKMQSEAAVALSSLERQNRQVDNLLYRVLQKGI